MRPAKEFAEHRWNRSSFAEVARDLFPLLKPTRVIVNLGHHVPNSGRHALRVVRSAEHPTGLKAKGLLHLYRQLHDSLTVAVPSQSIVWFGTIQPADDGGPHSADEVALALKVFQRAFNTSEYTDHWTREQDFLEDSPCEPAWQRHPCARTDALPLPTRTLLACSARRARLAA